MIEFHVHIRSTDQFKQIGVHEKMTEILFIKDKINVIIPNFCPSVYLCTQSSTDNCLSIF